MKTVISAFIKAQKSFTPAVRNSTNPHFRNKYADLAACLEAVLPALNDNGLALQQVIDDAEHGITVETKLVHESGETLNFGKLFVPVVKNDAQGYGSALTYGRRYGVMLLGIAPEDDDGNAAARSAPVAKPKRPARTMEELSVEMARATTEDGLRGFYKSLTEDERNIMRDTVAAYAEQLKGTANA